jgi:multiple sugar transport system substrate-binding protein
MSNLGMIAQAWAQVSPWKPEKDAKIQLLRWKRFVQSEEDGFMQLVAAYTKATGVEVKVLNESLDDVQPKASVSANTGQGPDMYWGLYSLPHLFPQKCLDVSDVADYLGKKYGGWVPSAVTYGKGTGNKWIAIPICYGGNLMNYRVGAMQKAGFSKFPGTTAEFLEYAKATKRNGTPGGLAFGHASGDANGWIHWCLWSHGGNAVDAKDKVVINSPETTRSTTRHSSRARSIGPTTASRSMPRPGATPTSRRSPTIWTTPTCRSVRSASRPSCI